MKSDQLFPLLCISTPFVFLQFEFRIAERVFHSAYLTNCGLNVFHDNEQNH